MRYCCIHVFKQYWILSRMHLFQAQQLRSNLLDKRGIWEHLTSWILSLLLSSKSLKIHSLVGVTMLLMSCNLIVRMRWSWYLQEYYSQLRRTNISRDIFTKWISPKSLNSYTRDLTCSCVKTMMKMMDSLVEKREEENHQLKVLAILLEMIWKRKAALSMIRKMKLTKMDFLFA